MSRNFQLLLVFWYASAAWVLGGRTVWAEWGIVGSTLLCVLMLLLIRKHLALRTYDSNGTGCRRKSFSAGLPVVFFSLVATFEVIRLLNPAFQVIEWAHQSKVTVPKTHISWLPSTVDPLLTAKRAALYLSMVLLYFCCRRIRFENREIIKLLWFVLSNAVLMAIVGMVVKITGEEKTIGFH